MPILFACDSKPDCQGVVVAKVGQLLLIKGIGADESLWFTKGGGEEGRPRSFTSGMDALHYAQYAADANPDKAADGPQHKTFKTYQEAAKAAREENAKGDRHWRWVVVSVPPDEWGVIARSKDGAKSDDAALAEKPKGIPGATQPAPRQPSLEEGQSLYRQISGRQSSNPRIHQQSGWSRADLEGYDNEEMAYGSMDDDPMDQIAALRMDLHRAMLRSPFVNPTKEDKEVIEIQRKILQLAHAKPPVGANAEDKTDATRLVLEKYDRYARKGYADTESIVKVAKELNMTVSKVRNVLEKEAAEIGSGW